MHADQLLYNFNYLEVYVKTMMQLISLYHAIKHLSSIS